LVFSKLNNDVGGDSMEGPMPIPVLMISILLFMILFFGIGFILNMLLRATWFMTIVYPIIVVLIIDDVRFHEYFTNPGESFPLLVDAILSLKIADIVILLSGILGAILSGIAIKMLRNRGYQMF
jgi:purine-cytosine permease-like protein